METARIARVKEKGNGRKMKKLWKLAVPAAVVAVIVAGAWFGYGFFAQSGTDYSFKTEKIVRDDLTSAISASGTVEPEELVNVGAQVTGKIMAFGRDASGGTVDYGSRIKAGELLAQIDDVLYAAELRECKARKLQAEAEITSAKASISQCEARLNLARINWERAQQLWKSTAVSKSNYDDAEAAFITAQADLAAARAKQEQANAQLAIAEAALVKAQRNMDYCAITSPVDGIIIDRRVSIGQTVVSNMSASSIFLIAKDLKKMEVWVSVNEADIGSIKPGMPAEFTIDAFPGQVFEGTVKKIRLNATMSQNVVTYIVEVSTDNSDGRLIPYLTANVRFIRARRTDVPVVPNSALRFTPEAKYIVPEYREHKFDRSRKVVWVAEGNLLRPVEVKTGLNAGVRVELVDSPLPPGTEVVYGVVETAAENPQDGGPAKSPFMPTPERKGVQGGGSAANRARAAQAK